jgi:hypothetical protein
MLAFGELYLYSFYMSQVQPSDPLKTSTPLKPSPPRRLTPAPVAPSAAVVAASISSNSVASSPAAANPSVSVAKSQDFVKAEEFRKFIEVEILNIIKELVEKQEVTQEIVQAIAKQTLEMITPGMSLEELYQNAVKLDDRFTELAPLIVKIMQEYEEKYEKKALAEVSKLIKNGNYDAAQDMVKKVLQFKAFS